MQQSEMWTSRWDKLIVDSSCQKCGWKSGELGNRIFGTFYEEAGGYWGSVCL